RRSGGKVGGGAQVGRVTLDPWTGMRCCVRLAPLLRKASSTSGLRRWASTASCPRPALVGRIIASRHRKRRGFRPARGKGGAVLISAVDEPISIIVCPVRAELADLAHAIRIRCVGASIAVVVPPVAAVALGSDARN